MKVVGKPKVFISYARRDGRALAAGLRARVGELGFDVWQDVYNMEGGEEWWPQLQEAIRSVDAVVLLVTPASFESEVLRREWVHARRSGTHILPVTYEADIFARAPAWMRKVDLYILAEDYPDREVIWERFVHQLKYPPPRRPVPFNVLPVPRQYAPRRVPFEALLDKVLDETRAHRRAGVVAVQGGPGFGKTTLARALCHAPEVIEAFTGGVLWATLGESGQNLGASLNEMVGALAGSPVRFDTKEEAAARLHQMLADRDCLLVLDDVWDASHIKLFDNAAATILITTRQPEIVGQTKAEPVFVEEMSPDEALQVLVNWLPKEHQPRALVSPLRERLSQLTSRLGEWPLLLNIFGSTLYGEMTQRGYTVERALDWVNEGLDEEGLEVFQPQNSDDRDAALAATMKASLRAFDDEQKRRLHELSVFREDDAVPEEVALRLWKATAGLGGFASRKLLRELEGQFFQMRVEREGGPELIRFHDALREYLLRHLGAEAARAAHTALLDSYNPRRQPWHEIADDGYLHDRLIYHLDGAGRREEIEQLFDDDRWMRARFASDGYSYTGFVEDLAHAAAAAAEDEDFGRAAAALVRYALLRASVNSISANYVPALVGRAVELGMWTPERALSVAEKNPDPASKVSTWGALWSSGKLDVAQRASLRDACPAAVRSLRGPQAVLRALAALPDELKQGWADEVLREALGDNLLADSHEDFFSREKTLALLPSGEVLEWAFARLAQIEDADARFRLFVQLAPRFSGELAERALDFARREFDRADRRAKALSPLLPGLAGEKREGALREIVDIVSRFEPAPENVPPWTLFSTYMRLGVERRVVELLSDKTREEYEHAGGRLPQPDELEDTSAALGRLRLSISGLEDEQLKTAALEALDRALPEARKQLATEWRARTLAGVGAYLPDDVLRGCLRDIATLPETSLYAYFSRTPLLAEIAPHLREEESRRLCLALALDAEEPKGRATVIAALAQHLDETELRRGVRAALKTPHPEDRARLLSQLAKHLRGEFRERVLRHALKAARRVDIPGNFSEVASEIAVQAEGALLQSCLDELMLVDYAEMRQDALTPLATKLSREQLRQCLDRSLTVDDHFYRCMALCNLARGIAGEEKKEILGRALDAAQEAGVEDKALEALAPQLEGESVERALRVAMSAGKGARWGSSVSELHTAWALEAIGPRCDPAQLRRALEAVEKFEIEDFKLRGGVILKAELLKKETGRGEQAAELLETALALEDDWDMGICLAALMPVLDDRQRLRALEHLLSRTGGVELSGLTEMLLPWLGEETARRFFDALAGGEEGLDLLNARALLAPKLADAAEMTRALRDVFDKLRRLAGSDDGADDDYTARLAATHVNLLDAFKEGDDYERVFETALADDNVSASVIAALAPRLEGERPRRALAAARAMTNDLQRARALHALLPRAHGGGEGLRAELREALSGHLSALQNAERHAVLKLCADGALFGAEVFGPAALKRIARDVVEICWGWRWQ